MVKNKKIKLLLIALIMFIICIFSVGTDREELKPSDNPDIVDAGWILHENEHNRVMGSEYTSYSFDNNTKAKYEVDGEVVIKEAINYEDYIDEAIVKWIDAGKEYSGDPNYEIIDMDKLESGGIGTITVEYEPKERRLAKVKVYYDENDPNEEYLITGWTLTINVAKFDKFSEEDKPLAIAHEIGHIFGAGHFKEKRYNTQIMFWKCSHNSTITENDFHVMQICTGAHTEHNFDILIDEELICEDIYYPIKACSYCGGYMDHDFTWSWVHVGTEDVCKRLVCMCDHCEDFYEVDIEHSWTDETDAICNNCGHMRPMPVENLGDGLLGVTIDGYDWVINYSEEGTVHEWSSNPPKFSELHGYSATYMGISWGDIRYGDDDPFHRYCFNYGGA